MPIHDWGRVDAGIFHDFHQSWTVEFGHGLNEGVLPPDHYAMISAKSESNHALNRVRPPEERYAARANQIQVKNRAGRIAAVVEIISPGDKCRQDAIEATVMRLRGLLTRGMNLLIVDLFPRSVPNPQGIHKAIWERTVNEPFKLPADKPLSIAAYVAGDLTRAYVEPVAVGSPLPELPIFLDSQSYIPAPLESTYITTWSKCPAPVRELVENPGG